MKDYTIKAGQHNSTLWPRLWVDESSWDVKGMFTESCIYNLNSFDQLDWNKLFGVGYGFNHMQNSARWGWRWNLTTELFELAPFCHVNGKMVMDEPVMVVEPNQHFTLAITDTGVSWKFWCGKDGFNADSEAGEVLHDKLPRWGFRLFPYVGGNNPAKHNMTIKLDW